MKKTINQMSILLEQHNIVLPEGTRKVDYGMNTEYHEICHAMKDGFLESQSFLIDSRSSNHVVSSKESIYSLIYLMIQVFTWEMILRSKMKGSVL